MDSSIELEKDAAISFDDPVLDFIFNEHLFLLSLSKAYFCRSFSSADSQYIAVDFILDNPEDCRQWLNTIREDVAIIKLEDEPHQPLIELITRDYYGKPPPKNVKEYRIVLLQSIANAVQCYLAIQSGETTKAIRFHGLSELFFGMFLGCTEERYSERSIESFSLKGAAARHAENRAMKQEVFAELDANPPKPRGMDDAATAILAKKLVPIKSWRTIRDWVGEWDKLRSTGTP